MCILSFPGKLTQETGTITCSSGWGLGGGWERSAGLCTNPPLSGHVRFQACGSFAIRVAFSRLDATPFSFHS